MLSKRAKYALNALRELARAYPLQAPLSAAAIAQRGRIPVKFLEAILLDLNRARIITSKRGRGGAAIDCSGRASQVLFLLGPLCKSALWGCTAVPEIRAQAAQLARRLCTTMARN